MIFIVNNRINVGDLYKVKDFVILKNLNNNNIVFIDNTIYSFTQQSINGIFNLFYFNKEDNELDDALHSLFGYILLTNDVRKFNEEFYGC